MADRRYAEIIEHLNGIGHVWEGGQDICKVQYHIEVLQDRIKLTSFGISRIDGFKRIRGIVTPIGKSIHEIFGKTLTLVFENGKKLDFFVSSTSTGSINARGLIY